MLARSPPGRTPRDVRLPVVHPQKTAESRSLLSMLLVPRSVRGHIPWLLALALSTAAHAFQQQTVDVGGHSVPVIVPDTYHHGTQKALPVVLLLHGFCTPPRWQEFLTLIASRGLFGDAGPSVLSQVSRSTPSSTSTKRSLMDWESFEQLCSARMAPTTQQRLRGCACRLDWQS